ncbi:PE domain-containing protein [Amycolatopsis sp. NPDC051373]|uniref:PE domain-containing protein n=1 Tax=Amycolatopsis sp. NPDC051373 TaxID=3155801 RepID=UPI00344B94B9
MAGQEQALKAARFVVAGEGGGGAAGGGSAAGAFALDRDAMTAELGNLKKLQDRISDQLRVAVPMWSIQSPGNDPASLRNTAACNKSGLAYQDALVRQRDFVGVFIGKIEEALGIYESSDEQAAQTVNTQGDGGHF